jgi:hypothetical protein
LSVAVAHASLYDVLSKIVIEPLPSIVMTGFVVSTTLIVLVTCGAAFPCASATLYVMVYVPILHVCTLPDVTIELVISPSSASSAVAPLSVYTVPTSIVTGVLPDSVMRGVDPEMTWIVLMRCTPVFPCASVTLYVIV